MPPGDKDIFRSSDAQKIWGVRLAVVEGNEDPLGRGRVQIALPWLGSTVWALVVSSPAVVPAVSIQPGDPQQRAINIPEQEVKAAKFQTGDQVVVAFESGDISHPIVLGRVGS